MVLGLLATAGPQTSYQLWTNVQVSVSFFWPVARSQLYAEPQRLERLGLVSATQESGGRRRRTFTITEAGLGVLTDWLGQSQASPVYYDSALLRLFFTDAAPHLVASLARHRVEELTATLQLLENPHLGGGTEESPTRTLLGQMTVRADLAFWESILSDTERPT